ncbi:MAG: hypothetical protein ETSY2_48240 [Candidatus Entotheonella gemina]|uniref:Uncharacterized protein n=1 Tax=Candidatus Entotheonella gemina TaxID=1429439 RepID=W4LBL4_9BACT|nr:MAG: hypothetical protein ETSY2_48240 [Candidatus Entotheonella gemina]
MLALNFQCGLIVSTILSSLIHGMPKSVKTFDLLTGGNLFRLIEVVLNSMQEYMITRGDKDFGILGQYHIIYLIFTLMPWSRALR